MPFRRNYRRYGRRYPRRTYTRYGATKTKYSRKRNAYKLKVKRGQTAVNFRSLGLPPTVIAKLKFNRTEQVSLMSGATAFTTIRMNDVLLPLGTGTDQPAYFSQLCNANMYNRFTVYKATYTIRFYNQTAGSADAQYLVWYGDNADVSAISTRATSNALLFEEREQTTAYGFTLTQDGSTQATKMHRGVVKASKVFGSKKSKIYDDDEFSGSYTTNPTNLAVLLLGFGGDPVQPSGSATVKYEISVVYHVKFWDLANNLDTTA